MSLVHSLDRDDPSKKIDYLQINHNYTTNYTKNFKSYFENHITIILGFFIIASCLSFFSPFIGSVAFIALIYSLSTFEQTTFAESYDNHYNKKNSFLKELKRAFLVGFSIVLIYKILSLSTVFLLEKIDLNNASIFLKAYDYILLNGFFTFFFAKRTLTFYNAIKRCKSRVEKYKSLLLLQEDSINKITNLLDIEVKEENQFNNLNKSCLNKNILSDKYNVNEEVENFNKLKNTIIKIEEKERSFNYFSIYGILFAIFCLYNQFFEMHFFEDYKGKSLLVLLSCIGLIFYDLYYSKHKELKGMNEREQKFVSNLSSYINEKNNNLDAKKRK